jgi:hypothetical protein
VPRLGDLNLKCIWVEEETATQCQEIKGRCGDISTRATCEERGAAVWGEDVYACVWVDGEDESCQKVQNSCGEIGTEKTCGHVGAAVSGEETLSCFWLKGKTNSDGGDGEAKCILKVCNIMWNCVCCIDYF